ncbi:MAG: DUF692 domain-containing protein [Proteobacteria bacterium]|nr:DUF692 domain-containing protein [Pseudomonadota bacterium]
MLPVVRKLVVSPRPSTSTLPSDAIGVGLRPVHYPYLLSHWPEVGFFEIITENFLDAPQPMRQLARIRERYPVVLHGVSLNLLGHAALDEAYLDRVCRLADEVDAPFVTDHLCWTGAHGLSHHDLLPTPYTDDLVELAAERAHAVQRRLGRPFGLENLSSYVEFRESTMTEWEFYTRVVEQAGCWFMFDLNNIYVSSVNHGFDAHTYISSIDFTRVLQTHLAGHTRQPDGVIVDTHDRPICDEVWALYAEAWRTAGPFPTLIEWDAAIPPMPELLAEVGKARRVRETRA